MMYSVYASMARYVSWYLLNFINNIFKQEKKKNLNDFDNIYVFFELDSPDAQKILDLEALLGIPSLFSFLFSSSMSLIHTLDGDFAFGHATNDFPFSDALWTCATMFSNWFVTFLFLLIRLT